MIRLRISGWRYEPWRGVFYPEGLAPRRELEYAARHFPTVEINGSFYSLQRPAYYEEWYRAGSLVWVRCKGHTSRLSGPWRDWIK